MSDDAPDSEPLPIETLLGRAARELEHTRRNGLLLLGDDLSVRETVQALHALLGELGHVASALVHWYDLGADDLYLGAQGGDQDGSGVVRDVMAAMAAAARTLHDLDRDLR